MSDTILNKEENVGSSPKENTLTPTAVAGLTLGAVDSLSSSAMFAMYFKGFLINFLHSFGKFIFSPLSLVLSLMNSLISWRQASLDRKPSSAVRASVETIMTLGTIALLIGAFVAPAIFAAISPIVLTALIGAKTVFHLGSALYFTGASFASPKNSEARKEYRNLAIENTAAGCVGLLLIPAMGFVMALQKAVIGGLGIAAGVLGAGFVAFQAYQLFKQSKSKSKAAEQKIENKIEVENKIENENDGPRLKQGAELISALSKEQEKEATIEVKVEAAASSREKKTAEFITFHKAYNDDFIKDKLKAKKESESQLTNEAHEEVTTLRRNHSFTAM